MNHMLSPLFAILILLCGCDAIDEATDSADSSGQEKKEAEGSGNPEKKPGSSSPPAETRPPVSPVSKVADAPFKYFRADVKNPSAEETCTRAREQTILGESSPRWEQLIAGACRKSDIAGTTCNGATETHCSANRHLCSVIQEQLEGCVDGECPTVEPPFKECKAKGLKELAQTLRRSTLCFQGPVKGEVISNSANGDFCQCPGLSEYRPGFGCVAHETLCQDTGGTYKQAGESCSENVSGCDSAIGKYQFPRCECPEGVANIGGRYCAANSAGGDIYRP